MSEGLFKEVPNPHINAKQLEYQTKDQKTKEAQSQISRMESAVQALSGNPKMEEEQKRMYEQQYTAAFKKAQQVMSGLNGQLSQEAQDFECASSKLKSLQVQSLQRSVRRIV